MAQQVVVLADPGIDGAFALVLALHDPTLDILAVAATAGNVDAAQATQNVHVVIEQVDPPRWPRVGAALPASYDVDGRSLHGPNGLGGVEFPCAQLHHAHSSDKLIADLVRQHPKEVALVVLGPLTVLARAFDRDPELPSLLRRIVCVGGCWREPGNASAVAEFSFYCDPLAARQVARCGAPITLVPLDVTRKMLFAPAELLELPPPDTRPGRFLRKIIPFGIGASSNLFGIEGFHLHDVLGIVALTLPSSLSTRAMPLDVETRGELTRGMSIFDLRWGQKLTPNVDVAVSVEVDAVRDYIRGILRRTGPSTGRA